MRKTILLSLMLSFATLLVAQIKVPGTNVQFSFPNGGWKYLQTTTVDKNTTVYLYSLSLIHI